MEKKRGSLGVMAGIAEPGGQARAGGWWQGAVGRGVHTHPTT